LGTRAGSKGRRTATPRAVVEVLAVEAIKAVRAEEVTLRLDQVRGAAALAIGVEIGQRRNRQCLCI